MGSIDGTWIAPPGEYQKLVKDLCGSDPRLCCPDKKLLKYGIGWETRPVRAIVFEFTVSSNPGSPTIFNDMGSLQEHIEKQKKKSKNLNKAIYILENANQAMVDVIGTHLEVHPSMFMEYERSAEAPAYNNGHSNLLASTWATRDYLCMNYRELVLLPDEVLGNYGLRCTTAGRNVSVTRVNGKFDSVGMVHRRCIFWSKPRVIQSGWDCVVICDPPVQSVRPSDGKPNEGKEFSLPPKSLDGYVDFVPGHVQTTTRRGPPRTSLADDLSFYITTHASLLGMGSPDTVALFLKKIVGTHYTRQFEYFRLKVSETQRSMRRQSDFTNLDLASVEANWSDTQTIGRRLDKSCLDLEEILLQIGAPLDPPDPSQITSWQDVSVDFRLLYHRFTYMQQSAERANASITGLASIAGNRQAFREQQLSLHTAERSRNLTFIGLVFIPLAFISSLFSMAEPYGPGGKKFWIYFAISIPAVILVIVAYYIFDLVYGVPGLRRREAETY
ncbi:hypothetical protein FPSE5266_11657 [Fusarium pseudograminearum]|nr:hypothetical protein FPSE5266_11657 [Fusarium pseudograminearum]